MKKSPQETAASNEKQRGPLIVIIDELDRCRPSYAVELLEVAKHLFSVDRIVFVIAVNRQELEHSIRALYGEKLDAKAYLRRFFDVDFHLPEPDREAFINDLFYATKIVDYFNRTEDIYAIKQEGLGRTLLLEFSKTFKLTLRQIQQAVHRVGLVFASMPDGQESFFLATMAAVILRTIKTRLYHEFINKRASDLVVVEEVFAGSEGKELQQTDQGCWFEAILILASREIAGYGDYRLKFTPLHKKYRDLQGTPGGAGQDEKHIEAVLELVNRKDIFLGNFPDPYPPLGFLEATKRLELLDGKLIDGPSE